MTSLEIFLLRHGESEGNRARAFGGQGPTPLTDDGHAQAKAAAALLATHAPISAIYSSDLLRTTQTAEPLARALSQPVSTTEALRERSVGHFTGLTFDEAAKQFPEDYAALLRRDPDHVPPGGESSHACRTRAACFIDDAIARHKRGKLVFVSHAHAINLVLKHLLAVADDARVFFQTDNCAHHHLARGGDGFWRVVALNRQPYSSK